MTGVTPGYFETLKMRLLQGRDFTDDDTLDHPSVVIVNEATARAFWPGQSPIGKRIGDADDWWEIVGVVNDVRFPIDPSEPITRFQSYRPFAQDPRSPLALVLRGNVSENSVRRAVAELDADQAVNGIGSARAQVGRTLETFALIGELFSGFAALGLLLAALGIYGVIAGFVVRRTNEIGLRVALGAQLRDVLWLVIGKGLRLALLGILFGLIGAFCIGRVLACVTPELGAIDPFTLVEVSSLLVGIAMLACWLPARRAARVDPIIALRAE